MSDPLEKELKRFRFSYYGKDLKKPVFSFTDDKNLQNDKENLGIRLYRDTMINSMDWLVPMKRVKESLNITHGLDFGPGKISQGISTNSLKFLGCNIPILSGILSS